MNAKVAKKVRKLARRGWMEYYVALVKMSFLNRLLFSWHLLMKKAP